MPIYDIKCLDCGHVGEVLIFGVSDPMTCPACGGSHIERLLSAPSDLTGRTRQQAPGPGDHTCCGSTPSQAGCQGPGSCCGKLG